MKTKAILVVLVLFAYACNNNKSNDVTNEDDTTIEDTLTVQEPVASENPTETTNSKEFANEAFRKVRFEKLPDNKFRVRGEAQVFEATINWSVEDGHVVYDEGFTTATLGAPEWGEFDFTFHIDKADEIAVLNLIIYEISMKDGNQTNVLLIPLK